MDTDSNDAAEAKSLSCRPKRIPASQAYYWTEEWQERERKALADIKAGRLKRFDSAAEAVKYLVSLE